MKVIQELQKIEHKVLNSRLEDNNLLLEIDDLLNKTSDQASKRYCSHLKAKIQFFQGNYQDGISLLVNSYHQFGPHLRLLSEVAINYAMVGNYSESRKWYELLQLEYSKASDFVEEETALRCLLTLAKLSFEWMLFQEALDYLDSASKFKNVNSYWRDQVTVHRLRIKAFLNLPLKDWSEDYKAVSVMTHQHRRFLFDKNYSLLIAESRFSGLEFLSLRIKGYLLKGVFPEDVQLGLAEVLEIFLLEKIDFFNNEELKNIATAFIKGPCRDCFEETIRNILMRKLNLEMFGNELEWAYDILQKIDSDNELGQFRILNLLLCEIRNINLRSELKKRLYLIEQTYSNSNKAFLKLRWPFSSQQETNIKIIISDGIMVINGKEIIKPRHPMTDVILNFFCHSHEITLEELAKRTWNENFNESHYLRIKTGIQRINSVFRPYILGMDIFVFSKISIKLNSTVQVVQGPN
ncbi:MAG: hypothetical protein ACXVCY_06360 [Pseudobdellovibrionaceae bacterium]